MSVYVLIYELVYEVSVYELVYEISVYELVSISLNTLKVSISLNILEYWMIVLDVVVGTLMNRDISTRCIAEISNMERILM